MTRLAEVKAERDRSDRELNITRDAATLALRGAADHVERVKDPSLGKAHYLVSAYGLTRPSGGYVIVRFVCEGQNDSFSFHLFDEWQRNMADFLGFAIAAEHIAVARYQFLHPETVYSTSDLREIFSA